MFTNPKSMSINNQISTLARPYDKPVFKLFFIIFIRNYLSSKYSTKFKGEIKMISLAKLFESFSKVLPHLPTSIIAGKMSKIKKGNKKFKKLFRISGV